MNSLSIFLLICCILGIILVYGLYFTGNLPFVSDIQSSSGNLSSGKVKFIGVR